MLKSKSMKIRYLWSASPISCKRKLQLLIIHQSISIVFLDEEGEVLLVVLRIRSRPASRIFPVKVKPVKVKPGKVNLIVLFDCAFDWLPVQHMLTCPTYAHNCPQRSSSWQGPVPSKQDNPLWWLLKINAYSFLSATSNFQSSFKASPPTTYCHVVDLTLTSDHIIVLILVCLLPAHLLIPSSIPRLRAGSSVVGSSASNYWTCKR